MEVVSEPNVRPPAHANTNQSVVLVQIRGGKSNVGCCNLTIKKDTAKVVDVVDVEDLAEKVSFCRCWKSAKV